MDVKVTGESFSGAIDQIETLDEMTDSLMTVLNRNPDQFDGDGPKLRFFENNYLGWSDLNGYDGNTTIIGGGVEFGLKKRTGLLVSNITMFPPPLMVTIVNPLRRVTTLVYSVKLKVKTFHYLPTLVFY